MKNTAPASSQKRGFTLVELLVVILIIAALTALAFVGFQKIRANGHMILSTSRIKSLGQANALYATDHNGFYVPIITTDKDAAAGVQWHYNSEFLTSLIGDTEFLDGVVGYEGAAGIPEQVLDPVTVKAKKRYWDRLSGSYGHNQMNIPGGFSWGGKSQKAQHSLMSIKEPARSFNFITATDWLVRYDTRLLWNQDKKAAVEGKTEDGKIAYRHNGKAIAVFYDGHTEMISPDDMKKFDARGGENNTFWGGTQ